VLERHGDKDDYGYWCDTVSRLVGWDCKFRPMEHTPRHVPARTNDGWPVVGLITALTVALIVVVTVIHKRTYKHPTDPTNPTGGKHEAPAATH
jgi:hypothetical protein